MVSTRRLGDLEVSAIGFGCMSLSGTYGAADDEESRRTLLGTLDLSVTFFDTADVYGAGHNETLVGETLRPVRDDVVIATKFGFTGAPGSADVKVRGDAAYVREACDRSLERLGIDTIDLYYAHRIDPSVEIEETVGAMAELVAAGKVRHLGLSEAAPATIRRAHAVHPIAAIQSEYSLVTRWAEDELLATLDELGIGFVPFSPLGRGLLTGAFDVQPEGDFRKVMPRFSGENLETNRALVARFAAIAERHGATAGQLALAWVLAQGPDLVPIPGTRRLERMRENVGALDLVLTDEDLAEIEALGLADAVAGKRFPDALEELTGR
jgi:aryl-alcohol dehydrogenase-like predicted oxidoreductase